jgi:hypothetical protein
VHYYRRSWLLPFYFLLDAAVTNSYILYKTGAKDKKKLLCWISRRNRTKSTPRTRRYSAATTTTSSKASCDPHTKTVRKATDQGQGWGKLSSYRRCQACSPFKRPGRPKRERNALQELSVNALNNEKSSGKAVHRTLHECIKCSILICHNSHCWARHLLNP